MSGGIPERSDDSTTEGRSQFIGPGGHPVKRDAITGRILDVKADLTPFKGVRREK